MEAYKLEALRKLASFLRSQPDITNVKYKKNRLQVTFDNGYIEWWSYYPHGHHHDWYVFDEDDLYQFDDRWPEFRCQFTRNVNDPHYERKGKYFLYTDKYLNSFKLANRRIFINRLANSLVNDYVELWIPNEVRKSIINNAHRISWDRMKIGPMKYKAFMTIVKMLRDVLYLQSIDYSEFWTIKGIMFALRRLRKENKDITRSNMFWAMRSKSVITGVNLGFPVSMAMMLRDQFGYVDIHNHTNFKWVDIAAELNSTNSVGGDIHIVERDMGFDRQVILGSGPGELYDANPSNENCMNFSLKGEYK
jgi:hypothetical protein